MRTQEIANSNFAIISSFSRLSSGGLSGLTQKPDTLQIASQKVATIQEQEKDKVAIEIQTREEAFQYVARAIGLIEGSRSAALSAQAGNLTRSHYRTA